MSEFVHLGWHMDGVSFDTYMGLSRLERIYLHTALDAKIHQANATAEGPRDKNGRK